MSGIMKKKRVQIIPNQIKGTNQWHLYTEAQKREIIDYYLSSGESKRAVWEKYTGQTREHGIMLSWMYELNYIVNPTKSVIFADKKMSKKGSNTSSQSTVLEIEIENSCLKKRIEELEQQLHETEIKALAFSTMIDIAESELKIPIRKKHFTKPSKK